MMPDIYKVYHCSQNLEAQKSEFNTKFDLSIVNLISFENGEINVKIKCRNNYFCLAGLVRPNAWLMKDSGQSSSSYL